MVAGCIAAAGCAIVAAALMTLDLSERLPPDQERALRLFADRTGSESVRAHFARVAADGSVTVNEAWGVIETAKAQEPRRGLLAE